MDLATVNVIALLFGVIFITSLLIAAIKIVRSRHDAQSLGNRSVKVPLNDNSAVFDPTSSGLEEYTPEVAEPEKISAETTDPADADSELEPVVAELGNGSIVAAEDTELEEVSAEIDEQEDADSQIETVNTEVESAPNFTSDDSQIEEISAEADEKENAALEPSIVVAEIAGEPIYASDNSNNESDFQEIEAIESTEGTQVITDDVEEEEPTGAIAEGLIEEFLGTRETEAVEVEGIETRETTEQEVPHFDEISEDQNEVQADADIQEIEGSAIQAVEVAEDVDSEIDEIEDYFDPTQPAFAARASIPASTTPLFKVAPLSVSDEAAEATISDELQSGGRAEAPSSEFVEDDRVDEPVTETDESIAYDATVPIAKIDLTLEATVPITRPEQPAPNYSFEEVPEVEVIEDEVILGVEISNQITQLDADLDTIEELVREIELNLADFEPLSGFEDSEEEKAA